MWMGYVGVSVDLDGDLPGAGQELVPKKNSEFQKT